ncbi:MAG: DUF554 domain-containing protein [Acutalibacteraceae bacterium]
MLGTLVNTATILAGSVVGTLLKKGINTKYQQALFNAMGLAATMLGINATVTNMPKSNYPVLFIVSLALGSLLGYILDLQKQFDKLIDRFKGENSGSSLSEGLSTGILLYCIGTLSILGPVQSALQGDNTYLFTNATLDFVTSMALASTYGIGMALAAPVLFLWQGSIYLLTLLCGSVITADIMTELSIVGGILITSSGLSILKIKNLYPLNMLPSLFIPVIYLLVVGVFA